MTVESLSEEGFGEGFAEFRTSAVRHTSASEVTSSLCPPRTFGEVGVLLREVAVGAPGLNGFVGPLANFRNVGRHVGGEGRSVGLLITGPTHPGILWGSEPNPFDRYRLLCQIRCNGGTSPNFRIRDNCRQMLFQSKQYRVDWTPSLRHFLHFKLHTEY